MSLELVVVLALLAVAIGALQLRRLREGGVPFTLVVLVVSVLLVPVLQPF